MNSDKLLTLTAVQPEARFGTIKLFTLELTDWDGDDSNKPREFLQNMGDKLRAIDEDFLTKRILEDIEVYKREDGKDIAICDLPHLVQNEAFVFIAPEPLPAMYMGIDPAFQLVNKETLLDALVNYQDSPWGSGKSILEVEPVYLFSVDFSWMIALTTENTTDGKRLCVLVHKIV